MPQRAGHVTSSVLSPVVLAACTALVGACSSPQHAATSPGTTPAIWTASPAAPPAAMPAAAPSAGANITARLNGPDGVQVATAQFAFNNGYATITIATTTSGRLSPGFHDVHIHKVGKCEPNSVAPTGGAPGDFLSAGDHLQASGHTGEPASGDLPALQARKDGSAMLVTTTDAFGMDDLISGEKTAIIIHAGAENLVTNQGNSAPGGAMAMNPGDAGKRIACGVIGAG